jgi:cell division protein DivIC
MNSKPKKATLAVIFLVLAGAFAALLTPRFLQVQKLRERSDNLEKELRALKKQNDALEMELRLLRDDPVYLEKVARSKFNKAKEGEIVYKVVRPGQKTE